MERTRIPWTRELAREFKTRREATGLTQAAFADRTGLPRVKIAQWETRRVRSVAQKYQEAVVEVLQGDDPNHVLSIAVQAFKGGAGPITRRGSITRKKWLALLLQNVTSEMTLQGLRDLCAVRDEDEAQNCTLGDLFKVLELLDD